MRTVEEHEAGPARMIDELATLDARGIALHLQRLTDDMKHDVRNGDWPEPRIVVRLLWESIPLEWEDDHMKRHRHTSEQAVRKLQEGERMLGEGSDMTEVLRHLEIAESTWNRWRNQYGGMNTNGAKQLEELQVENARLKKLLAEAELDEAMLKELAEGEW